ncbi:MAG: thiamine phosphate synthase [Verrucomicrobiota bacterium]
MNPAPLSACRLYGIVDLGYVTAEAAPHALEQMLLGGVDIVQLRAKSLAPEALAALARQLQPLAKAAGVPFILNDYPQLAGELGADGTHVGQDDLPVAEARRLAGTGRPIIGKSTHSIAQALAAVKEGPDYIGFGPLFATPTKPDYTPIGIKEIRRVHELVDLPIFCIGGIKLENLDQVLAAGARRVVIVSGILKAQNIAAYCREAKARLE